MGVSGYWLTVREQDYWPWAMCECGTVQQFDPTVSGVHVFAAHRLWDGWCPNGGQA